jgi:hypothetical protein
MTPFRCGLGVMLLWLGAFPVALYAQSSMDAPPGLPEDPGSAATWYDESDPETVFAESPHAEVRAGRPAGSPTSGPPGPMGGGAPPGYDVTWYPTLSTRDGSGELGLVRQGVNLAIPLWHGEQDMLMARVSVRQSNFTTDVQLPDSAQPFPDQLWDINFGLNWMHQYENGWSGGLMTGFGSASDRPFASIEEFTANLGGFLRVPAANGRDAWQWMLMYQYGGPVIFPIPMLAYAWNPSAELAVNVGLPFSVRWRPTDELQLQFSYMPLNNVDAKVQYQWTKTWLAVAGYEFQNESYFLVDRTDAQDRFFALEQRLIAGLRRPIGVHGALELNGGYSFGRHYGQGTNQWAPLSDRIDLDAGPFIGLQYRLQF